MKLTGHQLRFYETFGFLAFPGLFEDDIEDITDASNRYGPNRARPTTSKSAPRLSHSRTAASTCRGFWKTRVSTA